MSSKTEMPTRGLVTDGAIGSEQVDSSGEILSVSGCDISSLPISGVMNWEHAGEGDKSTDNPAAIIGRCISAKKIFKESDCDNARELLFWNKVGNVPYIYGVFRLFDESGHKNAEAAAAIMRDQAAAGEDQLLMMSIEGSTIEKEGNLLKRTMARAVALTKRACNKTAFIGILHDPKDKGSKQKSEIEVLFEDVTKSEPIYRKLTSVPFTYIPMDAPEQQLAKALDDLKKMVGGDPSAMTGQAALERPTFASDAQRGRAKACLRDYDPVTHGPFKTYAKAQLPDASDQFLDYFSDLVDDMSLKGKLNFLRKDERKPRQQDMFIPEEPRPYLDAEGGTPGTVSMRATGKGADKKNDYPGIVRAIKAAHAAGDPGAPAIPPVEQYKIAKMKIPPGGAYFDEDDGVLYLKDQDPLKLYIPQLDDHQYGQILHNPGINAIHDRALDNWWALHKLAREGRLPHEILAWSALFSAMSPNTSVPLQELAYARLVDHANRTGWDPTKELSDKRGKKFTEEFKRLSSGNENGGGFLPQFMNDSFGPHKVFGGGGDYVGNESGIWTKNGAKKDADGNIIKKQNKKTGDEQKVADPSRPGYVRAVGLEGDKTKRALDYAGWHTILHDLYRGHGVDARSISEWLNGMKAVETRPGARDEDSEGGTATGFAPKTIRYLLCMAGMGNVVVPDTHFLRHSFGLMEYDPRNMQVKSQLWKSRNEHLLQGIDRYYYAHHPAVAYTREKMKAKFGEDPGEQALFPSFWLHWLTVAPHERMRGWNNLAHNGSTDHAVFFTQAKRILDRYGVPYDRRLLKTESPDGVIGEKSGSDDTAEHEGNDVWAGGGTMPARCAHAMKEIEDRFGETPAAFAYYSWMVPALLSNHPLNKAELLTSQLLKAMEPQQKPQLRTFQNHTVEPGEVEHLQGPMAGQRSQLVHFADEGYHIIVGSEGQHQKLSTFGSGLKYRVTRMPRQLGSSSVVNAVQHGLPHLANTKEQQELVDGVDLAGLRPGPGHGLTSNEGGVTGWSQSRHGHVGYAKSSRSLQKIDTLAHDLGRYSSAQREAAFHLLAQNVFGIGEHVPTTAALQHPETAEHFSVQRQIADGEHFRPSPEHAAHLHHMLQTGQLDKLALVDMLLNNRDRHPGNYLLTPGRHPGIHLIDNAMSMMDGEPFEMPHYFEKALEIAYGPVGESGHSSLLHPEAARWVGQLDLTKFKTEMERLGVPKSYRQEGVRRMLALKDRVALGVASRAAAFYSQWNG